MVVVVGPWLAVVVVGGCGWVVRPVVVVGGGDDVWIGGRCFGLPFPVPLPPVRRIWRG